MGCFPCFFGRQARFEREFDVQMQALHAIQEAQLAGMTEEQRLFADLQRSRAVHLPAVAPLLPTPRVPSMDSLNFDRDLLAWQNSGPLGEREHRQRAASHGTTACHAGNQAQRTSRKFENCLLASALDLPIVAVQMHYNPPSEITAEQWGAAQERLKAAASDLKRQITFLAQWPHGKRASKLKLCIMITACEEKAQQEQSLQTEHHVLMDQLAGLREALQEFSEVCFELHTEIGRINLAYNFPEQETIDPFWRELTRQLREQ